MLFCICRYDFGCNTHHISDAEVLALSPATTTKLTPEEHFSVILKSKVSRKAARPRARVLGAYVTRAPPLGKAPPSSATPGALSPAAHDVQVSRQAILLTFFAGHLL